MKQHLYNSQRTINNLKVSLSIAQEDLLEDIKEAVFDYIAKEGTWVEIYSIFHEFQGLANEHDLMEMFYQLNRGKFIRLKRSVSQAGKVLAVILNDSAKEGNNDGS